jgi:hypothetical protein
LHGGSIGAQRRHDPFSLCGGWRLTLRLVTHLSSVFLNEFMCSAMIPSRLRGVEFYRTNSCPQVSLSVSCRTHTIGTTGPTPRTFSFSFVAWDRFMRHGGHWRGSPRVLLHFFNTARVQNKSCNANHVQLFTTMYAALQHFLKHSLESSSGSKMS